MFMNRMGRMPFLILLAGALLLPLGVRAQDQDNQATPTDKKESTSKKKKRINPPTIRRLTKPRI